MLSKHNLSSILLRWRRERQSSDKWNIKPEAYKGERGDGYASDEEKGCVIQNGVGAARNSENKNGR